MNFDFRFDGKKVFVFGGTSGINLGIAEAFADAGATLGVASRSQDKVDAAVTRLSRPGRNALGGASTCASRRRWRMRCPRSRSNRERSTS